MNEYGQIKYQHGNRQAQIARVGPRNWVPAVGWTGDVQLAVQKGCPTRRMARAVVNDWLAEARNT